MKKISHIILWILCILSPLFARSELERIISFDSEIQIQSDGSMTITETIKVYSNGNQIKRGIYRTFLTKYKDRIGNTVRITFDILDVMKNGQTEPYHTEKMSDGIKIYFGSSDVFLEPGEYTYTLVYKTQNQLGFFKDYDELYWNVTGNDWGFMIENANATIHLPPRADIIQSAAYTGAYGSTEQSFKSKINTDGSISFTTTQYLSPWEGLTIAVGFTKGIIPEPTMMDKGRLIVRNNPTTLVALAGFILLLIYYSLAWTMVGKDPEKETIIPQFVPPDGYSPAATRFVSKMGYSDKVFAAAIVNMAVKGYITIKENKKKFTLVKTGTNESKLEAGEKQIAKKLFSSSNSIVLTQSNHARIQSAIKALKTSLKLNFETLNFKTNSRFITPGIIITIITFALIILTAADKAVAAFMALWLSGWTAGTFFLMSGVVKSWYALLTGKTRDIKEKAGILGITLFALPFFIGELVGLCVFTYATSPGAALFLLLIVIAHVVFKDLLKAPTILGRQVMDHIEGFRMYLKIAEEERLQFMSPPQTPEQFERYLPYAIALDVETEWSKKFEHSLSQSSQYKDYTPTWYSGYHYSTSNITTLTSTLGSSFSSAITSSSRAPSSSSGSSGGGFSGGGGGGGGGGGW